MQRLRPMCMDPKWMTSDCSSQWFGQVDELAKSSILVYGSRQIQSSSLVNTSSHVCEHPHHLQVNNMYYGNAQKHVIKWHVYFYNVATTMHNVLPIIVVHYNIHPLVRCIGVSLEWMASAQNIVLPRYYCTTAENSLPPCYSGHWDIKDICFVRLLVAAVTCRWQMYSCDLL